MKRTLLFTALLLAIFIFGNEVQAQFGLNKLVKDNLKNEKKSDKKVLDIEIYSNESRTEIITNLQITKTTKLYCRANLSNDIEGIDFYADKADSYLIYISLDQLKVGEGNQFDNNEIYRLYIDQIPNGKRNWIDYQKENKFFDFVIDMTNEGANSNFISKLNNKELPMQATQASIAIVCSYNSKFMISLGYLDIDFSLLLKQDKASQELAIADAKQKKVDEQMAKETKKAQELSSRKLTIPSTAFTDKNLEKVVSNKIASESDVEKVYKLVFIENRGMNRYADNSPKNRWCRANVFVKMTDGRCMKLIVRVYEDYNGGVYRFNGSPNYETSTEYSCSEFATHW